MESTLVLVGVKDGVVSIHGDRFIYVFTYTPVNSQGETMKPNTLSALLFSASLSFGLSAQANITDDLNANMSIKDALVKNVQSSEQTQAVIEEALKVLCPNLDTDNSCLAGASLLKAANTEKLLPEGTDLTQLALLTGINPDLVSQASAAGPGAPGAGGGGGTAGGGSSFGGAGFGSGVGGGGGNQASPQ